ncbi:MAG: hypothetical protein WA154_12040 [Moraxellaceae bacterium]
MNRLNVLKSALIISGLLALTACNKPAEPAPDKVAQPAASEITPAQSAAPVVPTEALPVKISSLLPVQAYNCLPAQNITATYDRQNVVEPQVMLEINGMIHVLYASSATESVFSTESGMADGEGMRWTVSADGASLTSVPNVGGKSLEKILYRCTHL